ncbi:hypothetical protein APHAL10511_006826 [Amanita phalloides]|nr:hypothetical protein APHAL10511_006826 [Amanita phalloides]
MVNPSELSKPYLNSISSSRLSDEPPFRITFDDWGRGGVFDWYRQRLPATSIRKAELRKNRGGFGHEFVVIHLENDRVYRVDRRPIADTNLEKINCEAEDSISFLNRKKYKAMDFDTDPQMVLEFGNHGPDLYAIIATCVSIQMDLESKPYTLQRYNCFFLARTIVTLLVRHHIGQFPRSQDVLRWDTINQSAISKYIFDDWGTLHEVIKSAASTLLRDALWPLVHNEAEMRLEKKREWDQLEALTIDAIRDAVAQSVKSSVLDAVKGAVCQWIIGSSQETVWHANLPRNLLTNEYFALPRQEVERVVKQIMQPELEKNLPLQIVEKVSGILPKRLINRLPERLIANLPPELLARVPDNVLERLPDDLLAKINPDIVYTIPDELLQRIPPRMFTRLPSRVLFTPLDDLGRIPDSLLQIKLQRMREALDKPPEHEDRALALNLLLRLPENIIGDMPARYRDMRKEIMANDSMTPEMARPTCSTDISSGDSPHASARIIQEWWKRLSILGLLIRLAPTPLLEHFPKVLVEGMPVAVIRSLPAEALATLPPGLLSKISVKMMTKLPQELLEKLPETLLHNLPRATLERVPDSLLERFPIKVMKHIPPAFLENLSEDLIDALQEAMKAERFEGDDLVAKLTRHVRNVVEAKLINSTGDLSEIGVRIDARSKIGYMEKVRTHEDMQARILDMIRKHSKTVAQLSNLGLGEGEVFNGLRDKTEAIWRMMRLHVVPITGRT